jgi:hypothetical protein
LFGSWGFISPTARITFNAGAAEVTSPELGNGNKLCQGELGPAGASSKRRYPGAIRGPRTPPASATKKSMGSDRAARMVIFGTRPIVTRTVV